MSIQRSRVVEALLASPRRVQLPDPHVVVSFFIPCFTIHAAFASTQSAFVNTARTTSR
jgi:hypothetical protein